MYYEEKRCEHGNWWYRNTPNGHWYKFTAEMILKKLNETHDELEDLYYQLSMNSNP